MMRRSRSGGRAQVSASLRARTFRVTALAFVCATLPLLAFPSPSGAAPPIILESARCTLPPAHQAAVGNIQAVMIFVDFGTASTASTPDTLFDAVTPRAISWYREESRGRATLNVTPIRRWFRLPRPLEAYRADPTSPLTTRLNPMTLVRDAITAADGDVDFSPYSIVYVMLPPGVTNTSFAGNPGMPADGTRITRAAMFAGANPTIMVHETGHLFGLPDLFDTAADSEQREDRFVGSWDLMGNPSFLRFFGWHRWKLGWLDLNQMRCLGAGVLEETVTPVGNLDAALKMVVVPVSPTRSYVVEVRDRVGADRDLCTTGVLVYLVDSSVRTGTSPGPIQVRPSATTADVARVQQCGLLCDAPYSVGGVARYQDAASGVTVEVLASTPAGTRVRVTAPEFTTGAIPPTGGIGLAVFSGGSVSNMVTASGCDPATAAFWVTDADGAFVSYVPGTQIGAVNAAWNTRFAQGVPPNTALIARCR